MINPREKKGWNVAESLLLDGGYENPDIRLEKVIFWPDNIVELFQRFKVKKTFDLLSVDTDSYDFFMLEAILEAGYAPRVIIVEYNANFEITEAKSIMQPAGGTSDCGICCCPKVGHTCCDVVSLVC